MAKLFNLNMLTTYPALSWLYNFATQRLDHKNICKYVEYRESNTKSIFNKSDFIETVASMFELKEVTLQSSKKAFLLIYARILAT